MTEAARRRSRALAVKDTRPGQVLLLAILALAPIMVAFVLIPLATGGTTNVSMARIVLFGTPILAIWSAVLFVRTAPERRMHRAARIGILLDGVALLLWVLVLIPALGGAF